MELPILGDKKSVHPFPHPPGIVKAVDDVSLSMGPREMVGIVGESGCGKSVLARSILRLVPCPPGRHAGGQILFLGNNLLSLSEKEMQKIRGRGHLHDLSRAHDRLEPGLYRGISNRRGF